MSDVAVFAPRTEAEKKELDAIHEATRAWTKTKTDFEKLRADYNALHDAYDRLGAENDHLRSDIASARAERDIYVQQIAKGTEHISLLRDGIERFAQLFHSAVTGAPEPLSEKQMEVLANVIAER